MTEARETANVAVVREIYERWNRNEGDLALDLFDEEVEMRQSRGVIGTAGDFRGHAGMRASARELSAAFDRLTWEPHGFQAFGASVGVWLSVTGRSRTGGLDVPGLQLWHIWTLRDGRVTRLVVDDAV